MSSLRAGRLLFVGHPTPARTRLARPRFCAVPLAEDPFKLEAVVVTGQTTTLERRNATTATDNIRNNELTIAPAQTVEQAMQGKTLGATISMNSGAPGGGAQVQIRGVTSILGNGQPLFVMDGVIIS